MSITSRISLLFLLIVGSGGWIFIRSEIEETKRRYREATEEPLVDFATVLASVISAQSADKILISSELRNGLLSSSWKAPQAQIYELKKSIADVRIYITDAKGIVLFDSANSQDEGKDYSQWRDVNRTLAGKYGARMSYTAESSDSNAMYISAPIIKNDSIIGAVSVGKATTSANLFIAAAKKSTTVLGLATLISVLIIGVLLTFFVTKPISQLTTFVKRSSEGYKDSLPKLASKELAILGQGFIDMRTALDGRKYIENYVQTLTHEIKSPLSGIKAAAEILSEDPPEEDRKRFIANITKESGRIESLIHNLLSLANLQTQPALSKNEIFDLKELVQEVTGNLASQSEAANIEVAYSIDNKLKICGDRFWVSQALSHILLNAIEFSANHSKIEILASLNKDQTIIEVKDQGAGIPEFAKEKIFDKFYSLPRPRSNKKSSGLGLALVAEIMKLHNGELKVVSKEGLGTSVKLFFKA